MAEISIFRQAYQLLNAKNGRDMTPDERELVAAATIPLLLLPEYSDIAIGDGLKELAAIVEES